MRLNTLLLLSILLALYACAPLRPLGPDLPEETSIPTEPEKEKEREPEVPEKRQIINIGIAFEKESATIECPEKKWEFKAGANLGRTEIETKGRCTYAGKTYRGNWSVLSTDSGLVVINSLDIEDYLKGVVPYEIGRLNKQGFEALKAQAVAARTYAYRHLNSRRSQGFDMYADVRDQVYNGTGGEDSLVNEAISMTRDLVIKYNGNLIEAFYHSTCGGKTDGTEVWGQENRPYLLSVLDTANGKVYCESSRLFNWEEKFSRTELAILFQNNATNARADKVFPFSRVEQIFIIEKFPSGRVKRLVVITDKGSFEVFGDRTRWLFQRDGKILPNAAFSIAQDRNEITITGSGFGHGIGMCQVGAITRAREGQKFDEILKAYYTGVEIESF